MIDLLDVLVFLDPAQSVVLDLETTGVAQYDEPLEISVVNLNREVLVDTLIKPTVNIHPRAYEKHGIGYESLTDAPSFLDVQQEIKKHIDGKLVIAYNATFDKRILEQTFDKFGIIQPFCDWSCLMKACTERFGKQQSLESVCFSYGIDYRPHRALPDVLASIEVIERLK